VPGGATIVARPPADGCAELAGYESDLDRLLDRVFDEYGLVVCGWSADWDITLKAAIDRAPSRRFPMYWTSRGVPSSAPQGVDRAPMRAQGQHRGR
jgi:hypothetical protein